MSDRGSLFTALAPKLRERSTALAVASRDAVGEKRQSLVDDAELLADAAAALLAADRLHTGLSQIEARLRKPNGVITNDWYYESVGAANALARLALIEAKDSHGDV